MEIHGTWMGNLMKNKLLLAALALMAVPFSAAPAFADWHGGDRVNVSVGFGCCYGRPYYPYYGYPAYYPYSYPYYYAPPPTVVYAQPAPVVYATPSPAPVAYTTAPAPTMSANQASPTFTDNSGRTCREYQSTAVIDGSSQPTYGTACLQPDGTWRVVQ